MQQLRPVVRYYWFLKSSLIILEPLSRRHVHRVDLHVASVPPTGNSSP